MKLIHSITLSVVVFASAFACAVDQNDHQAHHDATAASSKVSKTDNSKASLVKPAAHECMEKESMEKMDSQMKAMEEIHQKIMNAKTVEERKTYMAEHMKTMQGGMAVMNGMSKTCMAPKADVAAVKNTDTEKKSDMTCDMHCEMKAHNNMMEKRLDMMEAMMQMVIDRINSENYDDYTDRVLKK